jgi:hypothetical protein
VRLDAAFKKRDFSDPITFPAVDLNVDWFAWQAMGGPREAQITARGAERDLWEMLEWLRAPVRILEAYGEPVWWGYVHEITVTVGVVQVGVSLDGMYNRIAVAYAQLDDGESGTGDRATTSWVQDDESVGTYGTRELLASLSSATATAAAQYRDALLAAFRYPTPVHRFRGGRQDLQATVRCLGWWPTLWWQYYANAGTNEVATTTQIATIVAGEAPLLQGTDVIDASGVSTVENRTGDEPAGQIIAELAKLGTTNDRRLLATVTRDRYLRVVEEPAFTPGTVELFMAGDGRITTRWGNDWLGLTNPTGRWILLRDVIPATLDVNRLAGAEHFFTEGARYDPERELWVPEPRGLPSAWEMAPLQEG